MTSGPASARARVRRAAHRASYDRETAYAILDEALICHVAYVRDGSPVVIPTIHARKDDVLYLHGSPAAGFIRDGADVCVSVTILDGLVLARSAFHHSMNYRSVVAHGPARRVTDPDELLIAFEAVTEHVVPGRWPHLRPITSEEIRQTAIVALDLNEISAKVRTGPPKEGEGDEELPIWGGVLPVRLQTSAPLADEHVRDGLEPPAHVTDYTRPTAG